MTITYRPMRPEEGELVCDLVTKVFNQFVAPTYAPEGAREFLRYVDPAKLVQRSQGNHCTIVGESQGQIVGMVEVRNGNHISLLFVEAREQKRGIARGLMQYVIAAHKPEGITVHSSPNAVPIYARLGFVPNGPEQTKSGIRFVPMTWKKRSGKDSANQASDAIGVEATPQHQR